MTLGTREIVAAAFTKAFNAVCCFRFTFTELLSSVKYNIKNPELYCAGTMAMEIAIGELSHYVYFEIRARALGSMPIDLSAWSRIDSLGYHMLQLCREKQKRMHDTFVVSHSCVAVHIIGILNAKLGCRFCCIGLLLLCLYIYT